MRKARNKKRVVKVAQWEAVSYRPWTVEARSRKMYRHWWSVKPGRETFLTIIWASSRREMHSIFREKYPNLVIVSSR